MHQGCRERCPHYRLQRKPIVSDPGMNHDACVTHVPWYMSRSLTRGGGENVPGNPGTCATRKFTYLERGPLRPPSHRCGINPEESASVWLPCKRSSTLAREGDQWRRQGVVLNLRCTIQEGENPGVGWSQNHIESGFTISINFVGTWTCQSVKYAIFSAHFGNCAWGYILAIQQKLYTDYEINVFDGLEYPTLPVMNIMLNESSVFPLTYEKQFNLESLKVTESDAGTTKRLHESTLTGSETQQKRSILHPNPNPAVASFANMA